MLHQLFVLLILRASEQQTVLQMRSHKSREGTIPSLNFCPCSFGCSPGFIWLSGLQVLTAHSACFLSPQIYLCRAALNHFSTQPVAVSGIAATQVKILVLCCVEFCDAYMVSPLYRDLLWRSLLIHPFPPVCWPHHRAQCCQYTVWGALNPSVPVPSEDVEQCQPQHWPLRDTTHRFPPHGQWAFDRYSLWDQLRFSKLIIIQYIKLRERFVSVLSKDGWPFKLIQW